MLTDVAILLIAVLFGVIGLYLSLIAKFYRAKFGKGPRAAWLQVSLAVALVGLVLRMGAFDALPNWVPALLSSAGALAFSALAYRVYRTMMSA